MVLLSIYNACHRPPRQLLVSARLDGTNELFSTVEKEQAKQRPPALESVKSHLSLSQVTQIDRLLRNFTIGPSGASQEELIHELVVPLSDPFATTQKSPPRTGLSERTFAKTRMRKNEASRKHVNFSTVHIREHAVTVGNHDWCEGSLPIQLDWQHTGTRSIPLDDFEWQRQRQGRVPRGRLPKLDFAQRKRLLRRVSGIMEEDLLLLERQHIDSKYVTLHRSKTMTMYQP
jgi:hypothetical protein